MAEEEANIASSKGALVTTISFLVNMPKKELEDRLKNSEYVDEYEIEELDEVDVRKDVFIILKNPVDARYVADVLKEILFS